MAIRVEDMKLIGGENELYNITADPEERTNLFDQLPGFVDYLTNRMNKIVNRVNDREKRSNVGKEKWVC